MVQCDSIECLHITITEIGWQEWEGLCEAAENGYFCSSLVSMLTAHFQGICVHALSTPGLILTQDPAHSI